jgi:hypothetical protein
MAVPASGAIKFSELQSTFGGSNPISLSEYYYGGSLMPTLSYSNYSTGLSGVKVFNVPGSGSISLADFYSARVALTYNNSTSPINTGYFNGYSPVTVTGSVSSLIGSLGSGDTFIATAFLHPSTQWYYANTDAATMVCTYGSSASVGTPGIYSKQFRFTISYDGSDTISIYAYYWGNSTGSPNGGAHLQGIVRTSV